MAKSLKNILEVYAPKSKDEKRFKDKHIVVKSKLDDKGTQDDNLFNASNIKPVDRETEHGYNPGNDEKVYEAVHPMALHVKPVSVNGKTKYKVHAVGKELADGIKVGEHLSDTELDDATDMGAKIKHLKEDNLNEKKLTPAEMKKREDVAKAIKRENPNMPMAKKMAIATATAKKVAEDVEELDELSHGTLRSYVDKAKKENLPGKGGNRGVALLTPGTRDKGVHRAVDRMKKMKANEEAEYINESEDSHKAFQDHHNIAAKHIKGITKALSSHYDNVTNNKNYNKGEAQWHHVSAIKNINRALEDLHQNIAQEVDYSRPPKPLKEEADYFEDDLTDLLNTIYEHLSDENKQIFDEIIDHDPNQLVDFLEALEIEYGQ